MWYGGCEDAVQLSSAVPPDMSTRRVTVQVTAWATQVEVWASHQRVMRSEGKAEATRTVSTPATDKALAPLVEYS